MEEKNKNWNLKKLERQAMENQNFDNFVLNQSYLAPKRQVQKIFDISDKLSLKRTYLLLRELYLLHSHQNQFCNLSNTYLKTTVLI